MRRCRARAAGATSRQDLNKPEAMAEAASMPDGFLHTRRRRRPRGAGTSRIVDRVKELIKYHGYHIAAELEALPPGHPKVLDAAVIFGAPHADSRRFP